MLYKAIILLTCLVSTISFGQVSVYECGNTPNNVFNSNVVNNNSVILSSDILLPQSSTHNLSSNDVNSIESSNCITVEPNFDAGNYTSGELDLKITSWGLSDVLCFSHNDLNIESLEKFEFGIKLPEPIYTKVEDFETNSDTLTGAINPFLEWQISAIATITHTSTGFTKKIHGFYSKDYQRNTSSQNENLWGWDEIENNHNFRFRYSFPEKEGSWRVTIELKIDGENYAYYNPFFVNVKNNNNPDFVKVAPNNRVLTQNDDLFLPIGSNLPWPPSDIPGNGINAGSYSPNPVNCKPHIVYEQTLVDYANSGNKFFRLLLNPMSLDIEFEEVGNYKKRLMYGWEIDNIINQCEELDLYIHFNMLVHTGLEETSAFYFFNWDWSDAYSNSPSNNQNGYKTNFNLPNDKPELFLTNLDCKKYYKQKIRYLISRYGYSQNIALFELLSEANNVGQNYSYESGSAVNIERPYDNINQQVPIDVYNWHKTMAKYLKNNLNHTEHLLSVNYTGILHPTDLSYGIPEVDVVTWNAYSNWTTKYESWIGVVEDNFNSYNKPIIWSETGPIGGQETTCDGGVTYRKEAASSAFTGIAGYNFWLTDTDANNSYVWQQTANVRSYILNTPRVKSTFLGNYTAHFAGDNGLNSKPTKKQYLYLHNPLGTSAGVISNLTDNYYTNNTSSDPDAFCSNIVNIIEDQETDPPNSKQNLLYSQSSVKYHHSGLSQSSMYYDQNYSYITYNGYNYGNLWVPHPQSCVTQSCQNYNTSEILVATEWERDERRNSRMATNINYDSVNKQSSVKNITLKSKIAENNILNLEDRIVPNPNNGIFRVELKNTSFDKIVIQNSLGHILYNGDFQNNVQDFSYLTSGLYELKLINTSTNKTSIVKWIKQ